MYCYIIGSIILENESKDYKRQCRMIGEELFYAGHSLIICSLFDDSADHWVLEGFLAASKGDLKENQNITIHYLDSNISKEQREQLESRLTNRHSLIMIPHNQLSPKADVQLSWLYCQLEALNQSHCVIAVGGKETGTAGLLLACARQKRKFVIPIPSFGGIAEQYLLENQYQLKEGLGLTSVGVFWNFNSLLIHIRTYLRDGFGKEKKADKQAENYYPKRIFISYSRRRHAEADFVEKLLLRKNVMVFRDETDFGAGVALSSNICELIYQSNICLVLWCADYACSPWCYDEFEMALDRKERGKMEIWILCLDRTRIVPRRARDLMQYPAGTREDLEKRINILLKS